LTIILSSSKAVGCSIPHGNFLDQKIALSVFEDDLFDNGVVISVQSEFNGVKGEADAFFVLLEELS
jgi:hypothetical protein